MSSNHEGQSDSLSMSYVMGSGTVEEAWLSGLGREHGIER